MKTFQKDRFDQERKLWQSQGLKNFSYNYYWFCGEGYGSYKIKIVDGKIDKVIPEKDSFVGPETSRFLLKSVFEMVEKQYKRYKDNPKRDGRELKKFEVSYDTKFHFINNFSTHFKTPPNLMDASGCTYSISNFKVE
ncbi:MAG: DUF6174 domain-containing protein [Spirochaetota bacterium]